MVFLLNLLNKLVESTETTLIITNIYLITIVDNIDEVLWIGLLEFELDATGIDREIITVLIVLLGSNIVVVLVMTVSTGQIESTHESQEGGVMCRIQVHCPASLVVDGAVHGEDEFLEELGGVELELLGSAEEYVQYWPDEVELHRSSDVNVRRVPPFPLVLIHLEIVIGIRNLLQILSLFHWEIVIECLFCPVE